MSATMVSPNDLHAAAIRMMLDGRPPQTRKQWMLCANFWASNIEQGLELASIHLLALILECPLSSDDLVKIAEFQLARKKRETDR